MGKQNACIHTVEFCSALKRNDIYDATKQINLENMGESSWRQNDKYSNFTDTKYKEQKTSDRQNVDQS